MAWYSFLKPGHKASHPTGPSQGMGSGAALSGAAKGAAAGFAAGGPIGAVVGAGVGGYAGYHAQEQASAQAHSGAGGGSGGGYAETPEERNARLAREADLNLARGYRNRIMGEEATPTAAPQVAAPAPFKAARVGTVSPVANPGNISAERINSTFDPAQQAEAQQLQRAYLDRLGLAESGAVPSAAQIQMRQGGDAAVSAAYALAGGHKGYGGAALRQAQRQGAATMQQTAASTAALRAQEMAQAREQYGNAVQGMRAQDIGLATTGADLALRAAQANQGAGLEAAKANQGTALDVARMNQAAELQTTLTQAGFDQQTLMHMSDQQLQASLANAGFKLTQEQINDLRQKNLRDAQMESQSLVFGAGNANAQRDQQLKQLKAEYAMAVQANDQKKQDALLGAIAQFGASYATSGGGGGDGGGDTLVGGSNGTINPYA